MKTLIIGKKVLACGSEKPRSLQEQLQHYRVCDHEDCKKRSKSWNVILEKFQAGKPQHGDDFQ